MTTLETAAKLMTMMTKVGEGIGGYRSRFFSSWLLVICIVFLSIFAGV